MTFVIMWNKRSSGVNLILSKALWQLNLWKIVVMFHPFSEFFYVVRAWHSLMYPTVDPTFESVHSPVPTIDDIYENWGLM